MVALLAFSALGDLLLRRVALQRLLLLRSDPDGVLDGGHFPPTLAVLDWCGLLFGYFTATLAILVAAAGLWAVICGRHGHARGARLLLAGTAGLLLPLALVGLVEPLRGRLSSLVAPAAALTALVLVGSALVNARIAWRQRIGLVVVAAPLIFQSALAAIEPLTAPRPLLDALAKAAARAPGGLATMLVVAQALAVLPLFAWRSGRGHGLARQASTLALVPVLTLLLLLLGRYGLVAQAAYQGLGVVLPLGGAQPARVLYGLVGALSLLGFASLLREGPQGRALAAGLALVLAAGVRWVGPIPVLCALVGLLEVTACCPLRRVVTPEEVAAVG
ncbi:MAG: hypothetical protein IPL40_12405 [Proteobacteria bacterium]|nr:hypothetical protein [Pseudomonadota bacterium]